MPGLYTHKACGEQHRVKSGTVLDLSNPVNADGVTLFRRRLYLQMPMDERCSAISLSPESQLQLRFEPRTIEVTHTDTGWVKTWDAHDKRIDIELTYPAPILCLRSGLYEKVAVHRVDGEAVSEQATVTARSGHAFPEPLVARLFQVVLSHRLSGKYQPPMGERKGKKRTQSAPSDLSEIELQGQAINPRLRLLNAEAAETLWQWMEAGVHTSHVPFESQGEALCTLLAPALKRAFTQYEKIDEPKDHSIVLPLLIESDAPCRVILAQATLSLLLEAESLHEPLTYTFDGSRTETKRHPIAAPPGVPHSLCIDGTLNAPQPPWQNTPPPMVSGTDLTGIRLSKGDQLGVPITIDQPLKLSGLALGWYNLADTTDLKISISQDSGGRPAAKALAEGSLSPRDTTPQCLHCRLDETPLQPGLYWIKLRLLEGSGIWLGHPSSSAQNIWQAGEGLPDHIESIPLTLHTVPLSSASKQAETSAAFQIGINGVEISHNIPADNTLTGALKNMPPTLQSQPSWDFEITSSQSLDITIKSIRIRYAL